MTHKKIWVEEVTRHMLHEVANFLNVMALTESKVDVSRLESVLKYGGKVYCGCAEERGVNAVLWCLEERKVKAREVRNGFVCCDISLVSIERFTPIKYLTEILGYKFTLESQGIRIKSPID